MSTSDQLVIAIVAVVGGGLVGIAWAKVPLLGLVLTSGAFLGAIQGLRTPEQWMETSNDNVWVVASVGALICGAVTYFFASEGSG